VSDLDTRAFRRSLTLVLAVLGLLTAGAVVLFGHLLFKSLSRDVVNDAVLHTKLDAERLARGIAERSSGDPYVLKLKQTEIDTLVKSGLNEKQIVTEVEILDAARQEVLYRYAGSLTVPEPSLPDSEGKSIQMPQMPGAPRTRSIVRSVGDPYDIEVPIGTCRPGKNQSANKSSSAISSEKMPSASVTAKPKIRLPNWPCAAEGLRTAAAR